MSTSEHPFRVRGQPEEASSHHDTLATECMINLVRAYVLVRPRLDRLFRGKGVSGSTFNVLVILQGADQPLAPGTISERLSVTTATVTGLLDTLEKQQCITRLRHPEDRRKSLIEITPRGREILRDLLPRVYALEQSIFGALAPEEKETLVQLLGKVQARAETLDRPRFDEDRQS